MTFTSLHLFAVLRHVVWTDGPQELNVVVAVVLGHLLTTGFMRPLKRDLGNKSSKLFGYSCLWLSEHQRWGAAGQNSHRSPFSCKAHSWGGGCASCGSGGASWDGPGHSSSSPHHLGENKAPIKLMLQPELVFNHCHEAGLRTALLLLNAHLRESKVFFMKMSFSGDANV